MKQNTGSDSSIVPLKGQPKLSVPTKQRILNIVSEQVAKELEGVFETQGLYITKNQYVTDLVKQKIVGLFKDPAISGQIINNKIVFAARVLHTHPEGTDWMMGGIKPEFRELPDYVVDQDIKLEIYNPVKQRQVDYMNVIGRGKLSSDLDSI